MPLYIVLFAANLRGRAYQSLGTALHLGLGNCANFLASNVFIKGQAPEHPVGYSTGLGITASAFPAMLAVMGELGGIIWGCRGGLMLERWWMIGLILCMFTRGNSGGENTLLLLYFVLNLHSRFPTESRL